MQLPVVMDPDGTRAGIRFPDDSIVVPTTAEFMQYTMDRPSYIEIQNRQAGCLQKADEKVAIAQQAFDMVDAQVRRLDRDLEEMERLLQVRNGIMGAGRVIQFSYSSFQSNGDFQTGAGGIVAKPNDLAAAQVTPGSEWILAKVLHHDPSTGMYKLADEDIESNKSKCLLLTRDSNALRHSHSLVVAVFHLPESQVILAGAMEKLGRGDVVYAVYPDTTSFYQATVVQAPRKTTGPGGAFVMVNFLDDSDENGITHDKAVPLKHIIPPP